MGAASLEPSDGLGKEGPKPFPQKACFVQTQAHTHQAVTLCPDTSSELFKSMNPMTGQSPGSGSQLRGGDEALSPQGPFFLSPQPWCTIKCLFLPNPSCLSYLLWGNREGIGEDKDLEGRFGAKPRAGWENRILVGSGGWLRGFRRDIYFPKNCSRNQQCTALCWAFWVPTPPPM